MIESQHQMTEEWPSSSYDNASDTMAGVASQSPDPGQRWPTSVLGYSAHLEFILHIDWGSNPLGPLEHWSRELRQIFEMILVSPDPATIFWGPSLIMIYNEAYIAIAGNKHPALMGGSARVHFAEVWDAYDDLFSQMKIDGRPLKQQNVQLHLLRKSYLEEGFFNLTVMPIWGANGDVAGFWEPVYEMTKQTLSERRLHTLLRLSERLPSTNLLKDVWQLVLSTLKDHGSDVLFSILYSQQEYHELQALSEDYVFEGAFGFHPGFKAFPQLLSVGYGGEDDEPFTKAFRLAYHTRAATLLKTEDQSLSNNLQKTLDGFGFRERCRELVVCPLSSRVDQSNVALLMIGVTPRRECDDDYQQFLQLLTRQVETTVTSVKLFEKEKARLKEQAAFESELKFKRWAERAPVGIFSFDALGNISFFNDSWVEITGHTRNDTSAMSWQNSVHPDCLELARENWGKLVRLEGPLTFEIQYKKPWRPMNNNSETMHLDRTWAMASVYSEAGENGALPTITGCVTDISYQKWADQYQSQRLAEVMELKRQQENFLDITSHEMRNPLNAILHCASEIAELITKLTTTTGLSPEERASALTECHDLSRTISYCGNHQRRIIDDVLTLSKLDSDLLALSPLPSRPPDIVEDVLKIFEVELRASNISTSISLTDSYHENGVENVLIDPHRVIQILINLVANAIKFMKAETLRHLHIVISASLTEPETQIAGVRYAPSGRHRENPDPTRAPGWGRGEALFLHFSVQDTGPGMSQEEADSLFHRFVQNSPRTHAQYGGSGLGLFISRELAELHGGRVGLSSQLGLGSTFDFYVICRRATVEPGVSAAPNDRRGLLGGIPHRITPDEPPPSMRTTKSSPSIMRQAPPPSHKLNILIVEDNFINQRILSKLMKKEGFDVTIANHGEEALAIIQTSKWALGREDSGLRLDVVLADIEMPVMDGKECVKRIRDWQHEGLLCGGIPVIAVTGNARLEQVSNAMDCGFDDVVSKPYQADDLVRRIHHFART